MNKTAEKRDLEQVELCSDTVGMRLDRALALTFPDWSRSGVGELIKEGAVSVNGETVKKGTSVVRDGAVVKLDREILDKVKHHRTFARDVRDFTSTGKISAVIPEDIPLDIVYEDDDVLVVDKPAGMVVHPAYANASGTLANAVAGYFVKKSIPLFRRIGLVHRLDKDVSGLMVIAKNDDALRVLSEQFSSEGITTPGADLSLKAKKEYWAVVGPISEENLRNRGLLEANIEVKVEGYIWRSEKNRRLSVFSREKPLALSESVKKRYALSYVTLEEKLENETYLLKVRIITGRTHQIRAQLASMGMPVVGDISYGGKKRDKEGISLRCVSLSFIPPGVYSKGVAGNDFWIKKGKVVEKEVDKGSSKRQMFKKKLGISVFEDKRVVVESYEVP